MTLILLSGFVAMAQSLTYEEFEESVINANAECPMAIGPTIEITSISINRQYFTIRMKINTFGNGLVKGLDDTQTRDMAMKLVKGFGMESIQLLVDMQIGMRVVVNTDTDESKTITLSAKDLEEAMNSETTPMEAVEEYINNSKRSFPMDMHNGMVMTDIYIKDRLVVNEITIDESVYDINNFISRQTEMKQNILKTLEVDVVSFQIAQLFVTANLGMSYRYIWGTTQKYVEIKVPYAELKSMLSE